MQTSLPAPTASGSFQKTPFAHLMVYALERRLTGSFEIAGADGANAATFFVVNGCPAKIKTTEPGSGEAGVDALRADVQRLFALPPETTYAYYDGLDLLESAPPTPIDPFDVLWRGVRSAPLWEHVDAALRRIGNHLVRPSAAAEIERFGFSPDEREVVDGLRQQPARIADLGGAAGARVAQLVVYVLLITKQVEFVDPNSAAKIAPPPSSGQAFARLQLQQRQKAALVVEEQSTVSPADDQRASTPGMPAVGSGVAKAPDSGKPDSGAKPAMTSAPPSAEHAELRARIIERATSITGQNYFQMLAVDRDSAPEAAQKAFIALAKIWHPDRLPAALADVKDQCSKVFSHLTEAHATLMDPERRQEYLTLLKDGGATPDDQAKIQAVLEAAMAFQKADILIKRNIADPLAYDILRRCVRLDREQPDYVATLAWVEAHRPEGQAKDKTLEKIRVLDRCIAIKPHAERAYFYRAMLLKRVGDAARAVADFKKAAELNPRNLDAVREVRLHKMRAGGSVPPPAETPSNPPPPPSSRGGGLFGKLFKK